MNIAISFNESYYKYAYVLLTSLFENHSDYSEDINVYVLHSDLSESIMSVFRSLANSYEKNTVRTVIFLEVSLGCYADILPTTSQWSKEMYYRLLLPSLLQDQERVLYLDVDIIVNKNISNFYHMDLSNIDMAVADDPIIQNHFSSAQKKMFSDEYRYFNSGVLLMNLNNLRQHSFEEYMNVAKKFNYELSNPDQDILNYVHMNKVSFIDNNIYNVFSQIAQSKYDRADPLIKEGAIIHFAGRKPWHYNGIHYDCERIWWIYAKQTPFYSELMESVFIPGLDDCEYNVIMSLTKENAELKNSLSKAVELCKKLQKYI